MKAGPSAYSFRPATAKDLPRLRRWLNGPEVKRWWGNPIEEFELLRADLTEPLMTMRIVSLDGRPFAYAQDYDVHSWPQPHLAHLPSGSRAIDSFIGWPSMVADKPICGCWRNGFARRARRWWRSIRRKKICAHGALMSGPDFALRRR